ncbi:VPLPA-CTERM protein sorting domain-containing protein [Cognatiyoonia sediminum]|uniref:VPLPA-CTERM protein sorting domain-containing protein n=1 Tax=Cognatiyoonia sediminum TaxID=1508389 RepID=A0A1M5L5W1_9RHOB|nr:VPLPA-CTERM sorting domain-containing protein [Cognatiyoonia sediminum]SHG60381.1 VPLPA-CTERM protein sorting domain-containing protein [Cognatiyoonia sediminum]
MKLVNKAAAIATIIFTGFEANAASINPAEFGLKEASTLYATTGAGTLVYSPIAEIDVGGFPVTIPAKLSYTVPNLITGLVKGEATAAGSNTNVLIPANHNLIIDDGLPTQVEATGASALVFEDDIVNGLLEILFVDENISGADYDGLLVRAEGKFGEISEFSSSFSWDTANISVIELSSITPVPIPAGFPLLLTAIAGFAGLGLRKKRKVEV